MARATTGGITMTAPLANFQHLRPTADRILQEGGRRIANAAAGRLLADPIIPSAAAHGGVIGATVGGGAGAFFGGIGMLPGALMGAPVGSISAAVAAATGFGPVGRTIVGTAAGAVAGRMSPLAHAPSPTYADVAGGLIGGISSAAVRAA